MFTVEQIRVAHKQVKSGADFPAYIQELEKIGVKYYEVFVIDGHIDYYGTNNFKTTSPPMYENLVIVETPNPVKFQADLKAHQGGKTSFSDFCQDAAKSGVHRWTVCMDKMSCSYSDKLGNVILIEEIR